MSETSGTDLDQAAGAATIAEAQASAAPAQPDTLLQVGADGDPLPRGTRMQERESYERVVEGLKIAADAAMHRAPHEPELTAVWRQLAANLDQVRRIAVQHAGIGLLARERPTEIIRGDPMAWRASRDRFEDGLRQAAGGMRQLAVCFRGDVRWSQMANDVDAIGRKMRRRFSLAAARQAAALIMPAGARAH
jgi:hypothetical protein